jgi:hypothetical protein
MVKNLGTDSGFTAHDHHMLASEGPCSAPRGCGGASRGLPACLSSPDRVTTDRTYNQVVFTFDHPTRVNKLEVIQHSNGICEMDGTRAGQSPSPATQLTLPHFNLRQSLLA